MPEHTALGVNCRAGTLLIGTQRYFRVYNTLFTDPLGSLTCSRIGGIATSHVAEEYSAWPAMPADVVFAGSEYWQEFQSTVKFIVANKYQIGLIDVNGAFFLLYESIIKSCAELAFREGYRTCYLSYNTVSFDSGIEENRFAFVFYKKEKNFNVTLPKLPGILKCNFDYFGESLYAKTNEVNERSTDYDRSSHYELTREEKLCIPRLPPGGSLKGTPNKLFPGSCREYLEAYSNDQMVVDYRKLKWDFKVPFSNYNTWRHIHPKYDRMLTIGEMMSVCGWHREPIGMHPIEQIVSGTPAEIGEWLGLQVLQYLQDKWEDRDYDLKFDPKTKKFEGGTANPLKARKYIDLVKYFNRIYDREFRFPEKPARFAGEEFIKY